MSTTLWIIQGVLCAFFLMVGGMKVFAYEKFRQATQAKSAPGQPPLAKGMAAFIGVCELAGAVGVIVPAATGIAPLLTTLAALGLAAIMLLASVYHLRRREPPWNTIGMFLLAAFVVYARPF